MAKVGRQSRRASERINPLVASLAAPATNGNGNGNGNINNRSPPPQKRRSNSWSLSEYSEYFSDSEETLAEQLTSQRWHEVGNGSHPLCASNDFKLMIDQLSSILGMRLRDLLLYWMGPSSSRNNNGFNGTEEGGGGEKKANNYKNDIMATAMDYLRLDGEVGDYVLVDSIQKSIREYVTCIGKLYNPVGFHSFEHCTHVTISMNKLLSMITIKNNSHLRDNMLRRTSEQCLGVQSNYYGRQTHGYSYGIGEDPRILFAMAFSALIHDVGHTGVPNSVLVEEEDDLAILHNDVSVAEQNSLQVAFSLLQREEFAQLKKCICPTPEERKYFRKNVICMVMVTDISDQERIQIVKSRWNAAFPEEVREEGTNDNNNANNNNGGEDSNGNDDDSKNCTREGGEPPVKPNKSSRVRSRASGKEIQSPELRASFNMRRYTMFSSNAAAEEFANTKRSRRLGIRTSMDFSGKLLDAYRTMDQLQQHAVLETMMNVADVAHTMQCFQIFCKWNKRLFKELYLAHLQDRLSFNPSEGWYENQIGFFSHYIIPLSQKMKTCGVFGTTGNVFEYFACENKKRWMEEGETISQEIIRDVKEDIEREQRVRCGCQ